MTTFPNLHPSCLSALPPPLQRLLPGGVPSIYVMAPPKKRRARRTEPWTVLNNVNNPDANTSTASKAPKRRHTTHRANIYDLPVSPSPEPQPEPEIAPETPERTLRSGLRSRNERRSAPGPDLSHGEDDHGGSSAEDAQPDEAPESSEDKASGDEDEGNELIVNDESEELGSDRSRGNLNLFSSDRDANSDQNDSPGSPNPSIPETPPPPQTQPKSNLPPEFFEQFENPSDHEMPDQDENEAEKSPQGSVQELLDNQLSETQFFSQIQNETEADRSYRRDLRIWFDQEIEESNLKNEWEIIFQNRKRIRKHATRPMPDVLDDSRDIVAELQQAYKQVVAESYLSSDLHRELRNLKDSLYVELWRLSDAAMWKSGNEATAWQIDQFQAHIIPKVINLLPSSFKVYRTLDYAASSQLQDTLFLLIQCGLRIKDVVASRYLIKEDGFQNACDWTRAIHIPLSHILKDLKQRRPTEESTITHVRLQQEQTWTREEEDTLLNGLQQYSGECFLLLVLVVYDGLTWIVFSGDNRYVLIKRHLGHRLLRRSLGDLRSQAKELSNKARHYGVLDQFPWFEGI